MSALLVRVLGTGIVCLTAAGCPASGTDAAPASPSGPPAGIWYQAQAGDDAVALARRYHAPIDDVLEINGLERDTKLAAGQLVFIPGARAEPRPVQSAATSRPARAEERAAVTAGAVLLWPVAGGKVTSGFGVRGRRPHEGIDIAAPEGTQIRAAADGTVIYAGSGVRGYGNLILIRHAGGLVTVYAHNRRNLVVEKTRVRGGQVIAELGSTGNASASHVHFEVRRGEVPEDPLAHLKPLR